VVILPSIKITMDGSTGYFGPSVLNKFGMPRLSKLKECGAPPLQAPSNHLAAFVLNSLFVRKYPEPQGRLLLMFGRRTLHAVEQYRTARELLLGYVKRLPQTNSHFLQATDAASHFEQCIGSACQAAALFSRLVVLAGDSELNDARYKRMKKIWNRSKHFDDDLVDPKVGDAAITAPVWLTNVEISCREASITFEELHSFLSELLALLKSAAT
jgi:hypothetical protein